MTVADDGTVFVASTWSHTIIKLDAELKEVKRWGVGGEIKDGDTDPFKLFGPRDIALAPNGNVMITDTGNERLIEYTADGDFVRQFGTAGSGGGPAEYTEPVGIEISASGDLYIGDFGNKRIVVLDTDLNLKTTIAVEAWGSAAVSDRAYMALLDDGRLLVTDPTGGKILTFGADGAQIATYDVPKEGAQTASRPIGIATDGRTVWVSDALGHVVRKIPLTEIAP
jgi:DNA-binding beta-propeller fold protein YncE